METVEINLRNNIEPRKLLIMRRVISLLIWIMGHLFHNQKVHIFKLY